MSKVKPELDLPDLEGRGVRRLWPQRWRWRISVVLALLIALAATFAWLTRERIAGNLIDDALTQNGLEASYEIESIGTQQQVITNLVVGDPELPDFTADRVVLDISYTYGPPEIGRIELLRPRLYGSFSDGQLSFGNLDKLLFAESEDPAGLPAYNVKLIDGRAQIASEYGMIGVKAEGAGRLDDGFTGKLAATAPGLDLEGCTASSATVFGDLTSSAGRLSFDGPLRLREATCAAGRVATVDVGAVLTLASDFSSVEGDLALSASALSGTDAKLSALAGSLDLAWAFGGELSLRHELIGEELETPVGQAASVGTNGTLRSRENFTRNEWTANLRGSGFDASRLLSGLGLVEARAAGAGTLVGGLLDNFSAGLSGGLSGGEFAGDVSLRTTKSNIRLVIPEAQLSSAGGETLIALSQVSYSSATEVQPELLAGNILTGGPQLPQINARVRQTGTGLSLRMTMAEYRAGGDAFAVPRLEARRDDAGRIRFTGMVQAEGAIPGGTIRGLELPVEGIWSPGAGLALGTDCLDARLAGLEAYDFVLGEQSFALCPIPGEALISYLGSLTIAAQLSDFTATGKVGESPAQITARGATVRYPGDFTVEDVDAVIGAPDNALRLSAGSLSGSLDSSFEGGPNGSFAGATAALDIVPLDLSDLSGRWRFDAGRLTISEGAFDLTERVEPGALARFEPLRSTDAGLVLQGGAIAATAGLVHLGSGRKITDVAVSHDLDLSKGRAELEVPGLIFDAGFQPDELTELTKGLIAFADGTVTGRGSISWNGDELTSTGTFSTDDFDFAAAFGPVRGVKGTIEFTDLLGMTTAPSQVATIASVNPGVEALDGQVTYSIKDGTIITVEDGRWPFMGGELVLRPVTLDYGGGQGQSYIFEIIALDAATFVAQMELANLGASGAFDGTIPIVFDAQGNGTIQGGLLISRPPGGNVSYVGELTYEDLGAMGNYAFQTLRSIDYNQMSIELNGNLAGEIITNFNIDGVRQGEGASQNFITRQLAQLPIRFKINVRSENFYTLATIVRGIFDPTIFGDPVDQGLFQIEGNTIVPRANNTAPGPVPQPEPTPGEAERRNEPSVQPLESDDQL